MINLKLYVLFLRTLKLRFSFLICMRYSLWEVSSSISQFQRAAWS
ncbi:unnamed protein product [Brassica oleracea]